MALLHSPRIITDGLVLCLDAANRKSYSGSGTVWRDLAGSNSGTLTNGPTFNSANGGSIVLDGTNDYVNLTNTSALNITTGDFALEVFFYYQRSSSNYARVASRGNYLNPGWNFLAGFDPNGSRDIVALQFGTSSWVGLGTDIGNNTLIASNKWWHACITRLNGTINLYINGIFRNSRVDNYNFTSTFSTVIGGSNNGGSEIFKGRVAYFRQYNKGLTPAEIQQNYNATKGRYNL